MLSHGDVFQGKSSSRAMGGGDSVMKDGTDALGSTLRIRSLPYSEDQRIIAVAAGEIATENRIISTKRHVAWNLRK